MNILSQHVLDIMYLLLTIHAHRITLSVSKIFPVHKLVFFTDALVTQHVDYCFNI